MSGLDQGRDPAADAGGVRVSRRKRKSSKLGVLVIICLAAAILAVGGILTYRALFSASQGDGGPVAITVEQGESLSSAAGKLEDSGAIGSATVFEIQGRLAGAGTEIKPGEYRIRPEQSNGEILDALTEGGQKAEIEIPLPEGLTLRQTARRVASRSGVSEAEFRRAAGRTDYDYDFLEGEAVGSTEGFLFPKIYDFPKGTSATQMTARMLEQYSLETEGLNFERAPEGLGLTEREVVTVASLIEREAANDEERPVVASVIYNRLREEMPLQIDATVQYALGAQKEDLSLQDLKVESPYNTYEREGLPPGAIASPGLKSIRAALDPADTEYRYYVLDRDGEEHTFTKGYEKFLQAKQRAGR